MGWRVRFVGFAVVVVAMPPQYQLFENEEHQDADQHRTGHVMRIGMLECVWQDFQKHRSQQGTYGVGNERIDAMRTERTTDGSRSSHAEHAAGKGNGDDPGKGGHGKVVWRGSRGLYAVVPVEPDQ